MRNISIILIVLFILVTGCKKKDEPVYSGTITIDNVLYGTGPYYAQGFSVPTGTLVSTLNDPLDVITILEDHDVSFNVKKLFFSTLNYKNSFALYGDYNSESDAIQAFNNFSTVTNNTWLEIADSVDINQIWIYKTSSGKFAKLRIIDTYTENGSPPYAECTFEWVYQPDGSTTFPEK